MLPVFIGAFVVFIGQGLGAMLEGLEIAACLLFMGFWIILEMESKVDPGFLSQCLFGLIIIAVYSLPFIFWFKKQSILRAWMLSLMGLLAGPGIVFLFNDFNPNILKSLNTLIILCSFYFFLILLNKCQRKYFPANKLANQIRHFLKSICLNSQNVQI